MKVIHLFFLLLLSSCQSSNVKRIDKYDNYILQQDLQEISKVNSFYFRGWSSLDTKHLILTASHNISYLIKLQRYCNELDFSHSIKINQTNNQSLSSKFDSITVSNQHFQDKCRIESIYQLSKQQTNDLNALRRLKKQIKPES